MGVGGGPSPSLVPQNPKPDTRNPLRHTGERTMDTGESPVDGQGISGHAQPALREGFGLRAGRAARVVAEAPEIGGQAREATGKPSELVELLREIVQEQAGLRVRVGGATGGRLPEGRQRAV